MNSRKIVRLLMTGIGMFITLFFVQCNEPSEPNSSQISNEGLLEKAKIMLIEEDSTFIGSEGLTYMREEEKFARDVYSTLHTKWDKFVFKNITKSEQAHMNALKYLLDKYNVQDPVGTNEVGVFTNQILQQLYNELIATGSTSLIDALEVGAAIEEIDILDLEKELTITVAYADVQRVYTNLMNGSINHLKAYVFNLKNQGVVYTPQFLTQEQFDLLMKK